MKTKLIPTPSNKRPQVYLLLKGKSYAFAYSLKSTYRLMKMYDIGPKDVYKMPATEFNAVASWDAHTFWTLSERAFKVDIW